MSSGVKFLQGLVRLYRFVFSPWVGRQCRFHPTCSAYALEALGRHGAIKGSLLALRRLLSCHPWRFLGSRQGLDPVPVRFDWCALIGYKRCGPQQQEGPRQEERV